MLPILKNRKGITFMLAMATVVILGILLGVTGQSWRMIMKREKEKELLFRGNQIKEAIESYRGQKQQGNPLPLYDLKDLLTKDPNRKRRSLRRLYTDPMTAKGEWSLIPGPNKGEIIGVASTSQEAPLKVSFTNISSLSSFTGRKKYSDWEFVVMTIQKYTTPITKNGKVMR